jgi:hypothetical protein
MSGPAFFSFASNAAPVLKSVVLESLISDLAGSSSTRPVVLNLASGQVLRTLPGRSLRDDPASRYGNITESSGVPILSPREGAEFFEAAAKPKNSTFTEGRVFIVLCDDSPSETVLPLFDALCFSVSGDPSSTAFVFKAVQKTRNSERLIPVRILITGEPAIEKAAEFYINIASEINGIGNCKVELSFGGNVFIDPEELDLARNYGIPFLKAFPNGMARGQIRAAARKCFEFDSSETPFEHPQRERLLAEYLREKFP